MFLQTASLRSDNCSPSPGQLFAIVRNGCSASFGITVRHHRNTQNELIEKDLVVEKGHKGEIFQVTSEGYNVADIIEL